MNEDISKTVPANAVKPLSALNAVGARANSAAAGSCAYPTVSEPSSHSIQLPDGNLVALTADRIILGRNPVLQGSFSNAQIIMVKDAAKTISKTHALLNRENSSWVLTDLGSTNGSVTIAADGTVLQLRPWESAEIFADFYLGEALLKLVAS